jgi:hypothetical protein
MQNMSRDARELGDRVDAWAREHQLPEPERDQLRRKLASLLDWLKLFRRALGAVRRYDANHPGWRQACDELLARTRAHLRAFGALTLRLGPGDSYSDEGIALPQVLDGEGEGHTFFCLFRDGIVALHLKPGVQPGELEALLAVVAANGRRDGDDAVTWLWSGRHRHLRLEIEPAMGPRLAATLHAADPSDLALGAYLAPLRAASADAPLDDEPRIERNQLAALTGLGVDPTTAERLLRGGAPAGTFAAPGPDIAQNLRAWFEEPNERASRAGVIRRLAGIDGGAA